jgi:HEAT repeat protein
VRHLLLLALLLPAAALAEDPPADLPDAGADEAIPELPVVEAPLDPVAELIAQAGSPYIDEAIAQQRFDQIVAMGASALPTLATTFRDGKASDFEAWVAARAMGRIGGDGALNTLIAGLESPRIIIRLGAVSGLELLADRRAVEPLQRALFDKAMTVRSSAADALGTIGDRASSEHLVQALNLPGNFHQGRSFFVRHHIVAALGKIGSIGGIAALIGVLDEAEPDLQLLATRSLTEITGMSFRDENLGTTAPPSEAELESWRQWWAKREAADRIEQRTIESK